MKINPDHVIEIKLGWFVTLLGMWFSAVVGGTALTMNYQFRIEKRLDEAVQYREFLLWAEEFADKNPSLKVPSIGKFHGVDKRQEKAKQAFVNKNLTVTY